MSTTAIKAVFRRDQVVARSVEAAKDSVPLRKIYERARGLTRPTSHRHFTGDQSSPFTKILVATDELAAARVVDLFPTLARQIAIILERQFGHLSDAQVLQLIDDCTRVEHRAEAIENSQSTHPSSYRDAIQADLRESAVQLRRAALRMVLDEREAAARRHA